MKKNKKELNVDYIGGETPLTLAEEQELSEYFKRKKSNTRKTTKTKTQKTNKNFKPSPPSSSGITAPFLK